MTKKKSGRIKGNETPAPQTLEEAEALMLEIGKMQREVKETEVRMVNRLAKLKAEYEEKAAPTKDRIETAFAGLQAWAESRREKLLPKDRKTAKIATGDLGWRMTPKRITVRGKDKVVEALKKLCLERFIRVKEEPNKEAMKAELDVVESVQGISISQKEEFWIKPFESEIEQSVSRKI